MTNPQNLIREAESQGFSLRDVARLMRVSPAAVSKWKSGSYPPSPQHDQRFDEVAAMLEGIPPDLRDRLRNGKARRAWIRTQLGSE